MVSRSTLINFCATLLCTGSVAAAQSQSSGSNRSASYLRQPPRVSDSHNSSSSSSSSDNNGTPRSVESSMTPSELAEFASSIAAYSAAYKQAIIDDKAESQQPAEAKNNINIDSDKNKNIESVLLLNEDFCSTTNNVFATHDNNSNNNDTQHHCSTTTIHGRNGVIQLSPNSKKSNSHHHHRSTITTPNLLLPPSSSSYSKLIITFSYQTTQMTHGDKFCLDLSTDNGRSWHDDECYEFGVDFENGFWYDGVGVEFELEDVLKEEEEEEDSALSVRWIVDSGSSDGDVLLDWVKVVAY